MSLNVKISRRSALYVGTTAVFGHQLSAAVSALAANRSGKAKNVILLWLDGGPSTIDMWDLKPDAPDQIRGEFKPIPTSASGVQICEHFPELAKVMDRCLLIRSITHSIPAHGPGTQYLMTGRLPSAALQHPSVGSLVASQLSDDRASLPPYVTFAAPQGAGAGFLGSAWNPFDLDADARELPRGVSLNRSDDASDAERQLKQFQKRLALRKQFDSGFDRLNQDEVVEGLNRFSQQAIDVLSKDSVRGALDLEKENATRRDRFGAGSLGRNSLRACRLIEAGARFVTVTFGGWDTHQGNFTALRQNLLPQLDKTLSVLILDLEERGLLDSTIVHCVGEFGRTPVVNGGGGRDHHSLAMTALLAGGGFPAGSIIGATDQEGYEPIESPCSPTKLTATILHQLGIDGNTQVQTPSGRNVRLIPEAVTPLARIIH
ncbi:DUF1501 domain-containing protein [Stieleria varia]|uniref:DUF1501 domain-containing protein n=1 Tax=Stieleria varia TaxID=2528005 RepID=A0A5C6ANI4_9BACT|nr:DUF1501 domain-containing protein [Stieleria varia]TWU00981.1 hypothetical protein Pla52n_43510 [Stieleria varia]